MCNVSHPGCPGGGPPGLNLRLGEVVDYETLLGEPGCEFHRGRKLLRINENVVGEIKSTQLCDGLDKVFAREEAIVWLGLRDMAKAAKFWKARKMFEAFSDARR